MCRCCADPTPWALAGKAGEGEEEEKKGEGGAGEVPRA